MNIVRNYHLIIGVLCILHSGCSELQEKKAPLISARLIEERLNSLNLSDAPPQWIAASASSGGVHSSGGTLKSFDHIHNFTHFSLKKNEREKFNQAIVSLYEDAGFKTISDGSREVVPGTRSFTFLRGNLEIHLVFVHLRTEKRDHIRTSNGNRATVDDVLIIEYGKPH